MIIISYKNYDTGSNFVNALYVGSVGWDLGRRRKHRYPDHYFRFDRHGSHKCAKWLDIKISLIQCYFCLVLTFELFERNFDLTCDITNGQLAYDYEIVS